MTEKTSILKMEDKIYLSNIPSIVIENKDESYSDLSFLVFRNLNSRNNFSRKRKNQFQFNQSFTNTKSSCGKWNDVGNSTKNTYQLKRNSKQSQFQGLSDLERSLDYFLENNSLNLSSQSIKKQKNTNYRTENNIYEEYHLQQQILIPAILIDRKIQINTLLLNFDKNKLKQSLFRRKIIQIK